MNSRLSVPFRLLAVASILTVALACSKENNAVKTETKRAAAEQSTTADATSTASPGGALLVPTTNAGATVLATVIDNSIAMKTDSIIPGPTVFTVTNGGSTEHNFAVAGSEGIAKQLDRPLRPGETESVEVDLRPGSYTAYCPILDHRQKGEQIAFTVKAK